MKKSKSRENTPRTAAPSPFERWMELCAAPVAWQLEPFDIVHAHKCHNVNADIIETGIIIIVIAEILAFCGAGLAVWCILRVIALAMRKTQRKKYYPAEKMRRQALAAERRSVRRRYTVNPPPTREELLAQFARVKRNPKEMIRFGSMLCDLEAYVDNSLRRDENGVITGRNPGIRGWFAENCIELGARYKTVMRYKAMAEQFRQVVGLRDPLPAALALDADESAAQNENTVRKDTGAEAGATCAPDDMSGAGCRASGSGENENTVRKVSLEERLAVGKARRRAEEFFAKCGATMRGAREELENRLGPDSVPSQMIAEERVRQGLSPKPGLGERFVAAVLA